MATFSAADLNTRNRHMGGYGNAVVVYGSVTPATGALVDVYRPVRIPAGVRVTDLDIVNDDLDTGSTAFAVKVGYEPVNPAEGPAADDDYFSAASTFLSAAGRKVCAFQPIKFEKDVFVTLIVTVAATTFASGAVTAIVKGDGEGVK
ncbi:MAG: hypothetical protein M3Q16_10695 [Pseudomonadota bacterium]|nr:hypothetical protein [Pseudomonadota bacterium]